MTSFILYRDFFRKVIKNEKNAYEMIRAVTKGTKYDPKTPWLNYGRLDYILKSTNDESYFVMPSQVNQQTLKVIMRDFASFFGGIEKYRKHPEEFKERPKMPGYKKKGGLATAILTNQICKILNGKFLRFPLTAERSFRPDPEGLLIQRVKDGNLIQRLPSFFIKREYVSLDYRYFVICWQSPKQKE